MLQDEGEEGGSDEGGNEGARAKHPHGEGPYSPQRDPSLSLYISQAQDHSHPISPNHQSNGRMINYLSSLSLSLFYRVCPVVLL